MYSLQNHNKDVCVSFSYEDYRFKRKFPSIIGISFLFAFIQLFMICIENSRKTKNR